MSDGLKSHIRTWWPIALGYLSALLVTFLAERLGVTISGETAYLLTGAVMSALVYSLGRWLETRPNRMLAAVGRFILSLGLDTGQPSYQRPLPESAQHLRR